MTFGCDFWLELGIGIETSNIKTNEAMNKEIVKDIVKNDVKVDAKVNKKDDEVKNLVEYFEKNTNSSRFPTNHEPQEWKLRFDADVFNSTKSLMGGPIDLKDRCKFEESRAIFSPGKRKFHFSDEIFTLGTSQTPKKRRENQF